MPCESESFNLQFDELELEFEQRNKNDFLRVLYTTTEFLGSVLRLLGVGGVLAGE